MKRPGFYRVMWRGEPGVAWCSIESNVEVWSILFQWKHKTSQEHIAHGSVNSTDHNYRELKIGRAIEVLDRHGNLSRP